MSTHNESLPAEAQNEGATLPNKEPKEHVVSRNEPCPCGSRKKYKRCHGVGAAPVLNSPKPMALPEGLSGSVEGSTAGSGNPFGGFDPKSMDPQMMAQVSSMLQRLPRGKLQQLQALMQKAMAGKDVSKEAALFEKTLPLEMQQMFAGMQAQAGGMGMQDSKSGAMTEAQAREIIEAAAKEGEISNEEAQKLLSEAGAGSEKKAPFWKRWKKNA